MKAFTLLTSTVLCFIVSTSAFSAPTFADVERLWIRSKVKQGYSEYQAEFVQYNNYFHLDTKDGCFNLAPEKIRMFLVINSHAVVETVDTDLNNPKAQCFKRTYLGLPVKAPPFEPFILNMIMN